LLDTAGRGGYARGLVFRRVPAGRAEAIAVVREHDPDVVLVDLEMPLVDGVQAIKDIRRISPNTTLLAVTGLEDPHRAEDAVAAGALACLSKADVRERLEALIGQGS
jgi:CheY-like chemotaxis protein